MFKKKRHLTLILSLIGLTALAIATTKVVKKTAVEIGTAQEAQQPTFEQYKKGTIAALAQEERDLWKAFETIGFTQKALTAAKVHCRPRYLKAQADYIRARKSGQQFSQDTVNAIKSVQAACTAQDIPFIKLENKSGVPRMLMNAGATNDSIVIVEDNFITLPHDAQVFALAHELQHITFDDDLAVFALREKFGDETNLPMDHPFVQYRRFTEKRADLYATLCSEKLAHGYELYCITSLETDGNSIGATHPSNKQRLAWARAATSCFKKVKPASKPDAVKPNLLKAYNVQNTNVAAINHYTQWLQEREDAIWSAFHKQFNITKEDVMELMTANYIADYCKYMNEKAASYMPGTKITQGTIDLVHEVLQDVDIPTSDIQIFAWQGGSDAATLGSSIVIDESELSQYKRIGQKFIIAHESIHYIYNDLCVCNLVKQLLIESGEHPKHFDEYDHPVNQLNRFMEFRADLLASLLSPTYTNGNLECVNLQLTNFPDYKSIDHPSFKERLALAEEIKQKIATT